MRQQRFVFGNSNSTGNTIIAGLVLVGIFIAFFWIAKGLFEILTYASPIMLILTLFIKYQVVTEFAKWIWAKLVKEPLIGILYILLVIIGFPVVTAYLLFKALASRKLDKVRKAYEQNQGPSRMEYTEYEVIEDRYLDINSEEDLDKYNELFEEKG